MMDTEFTTQLKEIALPVTLQSLIGSSLSLIDQIMIGTLGSEAISGIGLAGKFTSLFSVTVAAVVTVAGILIAQHFGAQNKQGIRDSFYFPLLFALAPTAIFTALSLAIPRQVMSLYSDDAGTIREAAVYLRFRAAEYLPSVLTLFVSTMLRNMNRATLPALAGVAALVSNTVLNWLLIFGVGAFPQMGAAGAALATSLSRVVELSIVLVFFRGEKQKQGLSLAPTLRFPKAFVAQTLKILAPILAGEFLWSLGENMYALIYGHLGTEPCAAMTLMYPIQGIAIGALSGVASAAGIITGESEKAWREAMRFVRLTVAAGILLSLCVAALAPLYVRLFAVAPETRLVTVKILMAFSAVFTAKVFNMVIGGGVLQSGGETKFMTAVNITGTWLFGVPLGLLSAYLFKLPIWWVYLILSLEEYVRLAISMRLLLSRKWMKNVTAKP